jgi:predicted transcriptional regulator
MADSHNPISDVMSRGAISVNEKLTLRSLAAVLAAKNIGAALIRQPDGATEIVSERDVVRALADGADPETVWAADIAADDIVFASPDETILALAQRMAAESVRHVAVVDNGVVLGVVSMRDVVPVLTSHIDSMS